MLQRYVFQALRLLMNGLKIFFKDNSLYLQFILIIINEWPKNFFQRQQIKHDDALVALTHDPKIDDFAIQNALINNCFYIGALGSKKTHENRLQRLRDNGFKEEELKKIFGPIGLNLGGRSAPEIALSIISQIVSQIYRK